MKKINIFGKKISILAILAVLLVIGTASAAVITEYFSVEEQFTVCQSINLGGQLSISESMSGGGEYTYSFDIENLANQPILVTINTVIEESTGLEDNPNTEDINEAWTTAIEGVIDVSYSTSTSVNVVPSLPDTNVVVTVSPDSATTGTFRVTSTVTPV